MIDVLAIAAHPVFLCRPADEPKAIGSASAGPESFSSEASMLNKKDVPHCLQCACFPRILSGIRYAQLHDGQQTL